MSTWLFVMLALVVPTSDPAPQLTEEVVVAEQGVVQEDDGTVEPILCGPNEPAPPRPK